MEPSMDLNAPSTREAAAASRTVGAAPAPLLLFRARWSEVLVTAVEENKWELEAAAVGRLTRARPAAAAAAGREAEAAPLFSVTAVAAAAAAGGHVNLNVSLEGPMTRTSCPPLGATAAAAAVSLAPPPGCTEGGAWW